GSDGAAAPSSPGLRGRQGPPAVPGIRPRLRRQRRVPTPPGERRLHPPRRARRAFLVADSVYAHPVDVLRSRAEPLDLEIVAAPLDRLEPDAGTFGGVLPYPDVHSRGGAP